VDVIHFTEAAADPLKNFISSGASFFSSPTEKATLRSAVQWRCVRGQRIDSRVANDVKPDFWRAPESGDRTMTINTFEHREWRTKLDALEGNRHETVRDLR
jgi:hypothetical protein